MFSQSPTSTIFSLQREDEEEKKQQTNLFVGTNERTNGEETKTIEHYKTNIACNLSIIEMYVYLSFSFLGYFNACG